MPNRNDALSVGLDVSEFNRGLKQFIDGLQKMQKEAVTVSGSVNRLESTVSSGIGTTIGVVAANAIGTFTNSIQRMGSGILETLKMFESLQFSMETMIALSLQQADASLSTADAFAAAADDAESYLLFLQDLAIYSPFTTSEVAQANRMLQIFEILPEEAAGLTKLMVDLASVGGLGQERLQRIAYATGQIFAEQRLLARDALQLTQAGVPILRFITDFTGKTASELQEMMRKGLVPASLAFEALIDGLTRFEGAGKRVAGTAQGLLSSIEDIVEITSRDLFKGIFEGFRPILEEIVTIGSSTEFRAAITAIGQEIGVSAEKGIARARKAVVDFIGTFKAIPRDVVQVIAVFVGGIAALTAFAGAIGLVQIAIGALINPFTVLITTFSALLALWVTGSQQMQGTFRTASRATLDHLKKVTGGFLDLGNISVDALIQIDKAAEGFANVGTYVVRAFDAIARAATSATTIVLNLFSSLVSWGQGLMEAYAGGIALGQNAVISSLGVIGSAITGLLKPGSPPKLLPDIDTWGRLTAQEWLKGWTEADFGELNDIAKTVRDFLRAEVSAGRRDEVSAVQMMIGSKREIANAVNEIRRIGRVTGETMSRVRGSVGNAADSVEQLLNAYTKVSNATRSVTEAQERLNRVNEYYNRILRPLQAQLERISELRTRGDEDKEIMSLRRTIANEAVSDSNKRQAQLRIEEILLGRNVRQLEDQRDAAVDSAQSSLTAREKELETAQLSLSIANERINAQIEQISLYGEEIKALENLQRELERLARELRKKLLEPLENAIKRTQIMNSEIQDTISLFKARHTQQSAEATVAEKIAAANEELAIAARRAKRDFEARELGISEDEINRLRQFQVTLKDIGIEGKPEFDDVDLSALAEDVGKRIEEFNKRVEEFKATMTATREEFDLWALEINNMLPPFLQWKTATGEVGPLLQNLKAAIGGIVTVIVGNKLVSALAALPGIIFGIGTPFGFLINLLGAFTSLWIADWNNIRERTNAAIDFIKARITAFEDEGGLSGLLPQDDEYQGALKRVRDSWASTVSFMQSSLSGGLTIDEVNKIVARLVDSFRKTGAALYDIELFGGIIDQFRNFIATISDPKLLGNSFVRFASNLRYRLAAEIRSFIRGDSFEKSISEYIGNSLLRAGAAFVIAIPSWIGNFIDGVNTFVRTIRPILPVLINDLFGKVIPAITYSFGRASGIIGSNVSNLLLTLIEVAITDVIPAIVRNIPLIAGAMIKGFADGVKQAENEIFDTLLAYTAVVSGFFAYVFGPNIASSILSATHFAFRTALTAVTSSLRTFATSFVKGFSLITTGVSSIIAALGKDVRNGLVGVVSLAVRNVKSLSVALLGLFGSTLSRSAQAVLTVILQGLSKILSLVGNLFQPFTYWANVIIPGIRNRLIQLIQFLNNVPASMAKLGQSVAALGRTILKAYVATMTSTIKFVVGVVRAILSTGPALTRFTGFLKTIATSFERTLRTVFSGSGQLAGHVVKLFGQATTAITGFASRVRNFPQLFSGITSSIAGSLNVLSRALNVRGALKSLNNIFTYAARIRQTGLTSLATGFQNLAPIINQSLNSIVPVINGFFRSIAGLARSGVFQTLSSGIKTLGIGALKAVQAIGNVFQNLSSFNPRNAARGITGFFASIIKGTSAAAGAIGTRGISSIFSGISNLNFTKAITSFRGFGNIIRGFGTLIRGSLLTPLGLITSAIDFFAFAWNANIEGVENDARGMVDSIKQFWADLISGDLFRSILDTARKWFGELEELFAIVGEFGFNSPEVMSRLQELGGNIVEWARQTGAAIGESLRTFWIPVFIEWVQYTITSLVNSLGLILSTVITWIAASVGFIATQFQTVWLPAFINWWTEGGGNEQTINVLNGLVTAIADWISASVQWIAQSFSVWIPAFIGWATETLPPLLSALGQISLSIGQWILEQLPVLANTLLTWATAFLEWLGPVAGNTITKLGEWLGVILKWIITDAIPGIVIGTVGLIRALVSWISGDRDSAASQAPTALGNFLSALLGFFTEHILPALWSVGVSLAKAIWEGFGELWQAFLKTDLAETILTGPSKILETLEQWIVTGVELATGFISQGVIGTIQRLYNTVVSAVIAILAVIGAPEHVNSWVLQGLEFGKNLMLGMAQGILDWMFEPIEKLGDGLRSLIVSGRELLGIKSPSTVLAKEIGEPAARGVAEGIESVSQDGAIKKLKGAIIGAFSDLDKSVSSIVGTMRNGVVVSIDKMRELSTQTIQVGSDEILLIYETMSLAIIEIVNLTRRETVFEFLGMATDSIAGVSDMNIQITDTFSKLRSSLEVGVIALRGNIVAEFVTMKDEAIEASQEMAKGISTALVTGDNSLVSQIQKNLIGDGQSNTSPAYIIGRNLIDGIAKGIRDPQSVTGVANALIYTIFTAMEQAMIELDIRSPSEVAARQLGEPIAQGVANGIIRMLPVISSAMSQVSDRISGVNILGPTFESRPSQVLPSSINTSYVNHYNLNVNSASQSQGIISDFAIMKTMSV